jgi:WD40 repeat protein
VTVARDQTSRVWEIASGSEISRIELPNPAFAAATFSPDGVLAATCAWERDEDRKVHGVVWIWDAATGELRSRQRVGVKPLSAIRFTPDSSRLLVGSWDGLMHVLDTDASEIRRLELPREGAYNAVNDIAISPDGRLVAAGSKDRTIRVFEIETGDLVASLRGHQGYVEGVAFSPDGAILASASVDATVRLWNAGDWSPGGTLRGNLDTVRGVAWTADGASLIACSLDSTLRIWESSARHAPQLDIHAGLQGTYSAALSPDGRTVAVACYDGWLRVFDAATGAEVAAWEAHPGSTCHFAAYSGDGSRLVTCSWDKTARVWDARSHEQVARLEAGRGVYACAISPDGSRVALTAGGVQIWDVNAAEKLHQAAPDGAGATRVAFSTDGALVAAGFDSGQARVYRSSDGEELAPLGEPGPRVEAVSFTPDGDEVITGDAAGVVRAFPAAGGPARFACDTGGRSVSHVAVAGDRIAAATDQLWILDLASGAVVFGRRPHADTIWHLSWSADGGRLATCCSNGTIAVLDAPAPAPAVATRPAAPAP